MAMLYSRSETASLNGYDSSFAEWLCQGEAERHGHSPSRGQATQHHTHRLHTGLRPPAPAYFIMFGRMKSMVGHSLNMAFDLHLPTLATLNHTLRPA